MGIRLNWRSLQQRSDVCTETRGTSRSAQSQCRGEVCQSIADACESLRQKGARHICETKRMQGQAQNGE